MSLFKRKHRQQVLQAEQPAELMQQAVQQEQLLEGPQNEFAQEQMAPIAQGMEIEAEIQHPAPEQEQRLGRKERKKREEQEKADAKAQAQHQQVQNKAEELEAQYAVQGDQMDAQRIQAEKALLAERLRSVKLDEQATMLREKDGATEERLREIRYGAQAERARLAGEFARSLPLGSQERKKAMAVKEEQELKADQLRRMYRVCRIPDENERKREEATLTRHAKYDALKKIFRKDNPLAHEDSVQPLPADFVQQQPQEQQAPQRQLTNVGRAFFGGTKPMYVFEDRSAPILRGGEQAGFRQYLFKEAVNCVGMYKPEGALVTEAAAKLQERICGPYSIPAFAVEQGGKVLGSFQEKIESMDAEHRIDLFSWQAHPEADALPVEMRSEILREHTLDWLLCNFDTKGENFLHRTDGHLCSFDKEASFSFLKDEGAQQMSTTYKPHSNDTIYNVVFTEFAEGRLELDLSSTITQVQKVEAMDRDEYMRMFDRMLTQKYGAAGPKNKARAAAEEAMWARKDGLREEYRRFYTELLDRRAEATGDPDEYAHLRSGDGRFCFEDERVSTEVLTSERNQEGLLVRGLAEAEIQALGATTYGLTLTEVQAKHLAGSSNGFLTYRKNEDGSCVMRPSMPETAVFDGETVEFRKNYKRFTRLVAGLATTPEGQVARDGMEKVNQVNTALVLQMAMPDEGVDKMFREVMLERFRTDKALHKGQTPEEAMEEFVHFMRVARGYNWESLGDTGNIGSIFNIEATGSIYALCGFAPRLEKSETEIRRMIQEARDRGESISPEMEEKMVTEDLAVFRDEHAKALATVSRCAQQDMDSDEVFLLGACSAHARLVSCVTNPAQTGKTVMEKANMVMPPLSHRVEDLADEVPEEVEKRMTQLTGKPFKFSDDPEIRKDQVAQMRANCNYSYHTAGHIGDVDGMQLSLESFAAESYQVVGAGFTDQVGIGLFAGQEGFQHFYAKNADAVLTPDQVRRTKFKEILGKGM